MSMFRVIVLRLQPLWCLLCFLSATSASAQSPQLGQPMTAAEVAAIDFTVLPSGNGLPEGGGNAQQGEGLYRVQCQACHGEQGVGGINDRLAGGHGTLTGPKPVKTIGSYWPQATTAFDFIRRAMPYSAPGTLSNDEVYALTAYLLHINGVIEASTVMNQSSLPAVVMPNRDRFIWAVQANGDEY